MGAPTELDKIRTHGFVTFAVPVDCRENLGM